MRGKGDHERSAGGKKNVLGPKNVPGMFSDDESESDAGGSSDSDRDDSLGGGGEGDGVGKAAAATAAASGHIGNSSSAAETEAGGRGSGRIDAAGRSMERDRLDERKRNPNGRSPIRGPGMAEAPSTPPGVTLRNRVVSPHDAAVAAAARQEISRTEGGEVMTAAAADGPGGVVLVERCYVMVSCHRNHPLMFKVRHTRPREAQSFCFRVLAWLVLCSVTAAVQPEAIKSGWPRAWMLSNDHVWPYTTKDTRVACIFFDRLRARFLCRNRLPLDNTHTTNRTVCRVKGLSWTPVSFTDPSPPPQRMGAET